MLPTAVPIVPVVGDGKERIREPVVFVSQHLSGVLVSMYTVFDRNATPFGYCDPLGQRKELTRLPKAYADAAIATNRATAKTTHFLFIV
jgi:hypothetical protein